MVLEEQGGRADDMRTSLDALPGRAVLDSAGRMLGRIRRVQVDTESWAVESLRVRLRRRTAQELGLRWSLLHMPTMDVPTGLVLAAGDAVILRAALDELAALVNDGDHTPLPAQARAAAPQAAGG
jgi:sporulation protein YlmC with PRC-barrel domain